MRYFMLYKLLLVFFRANKHLTAASFDTDLLDNHAPIHNIGHIAFFPFKGQ